MHAKSLFDLYVAKAEVTWESGSLAGALQCIRLACSLIRILPLETDYLAALLHNFGFLLYEAGKFAEAEEWLMGSIDLRSGARAGMCDPSKLALTRRLLGTCYSYIDRFEDSER